MNKVMQQRVTISGWYWAYAWQLRIKVYYLFNPQPCKQIFQPRIKNKINRACPSGLKVICCDSNKSNYHESILYQVIVISIVVMDQLIPFFQFFLQYCSFLKKWWRSVTNKSSRHGITSHLYILMLKQSQKCNQAVTIPNEEREVLSGCFKR